MSRPHFYRIPHAPTLVATSITRKTQGTIILALTLLLAILYFALRLVVLRSFDTVEHRYAEQAREHAERAISDQLGLLDRSVIDYAIWDDTYAFIQGKLDGYVASNFTDTMFESNQLDLVIVVDDRGLIRFQRMLGTKGDLAAPDQAAVLAALMATEVSSGLPEDVPRHMVLPTPQWPLMLSAHRVLRSDGSGPSNGVFLMGRWIDGELEADLSERLHLDLTFAPLDRALPADLHPNVLSLLQSPAGSVTIPLDSQHLGSYSIISDPKGAPVVLSQVTSDRPIWATGQQTILVTLAVFVVAGIVFIISITMLLDHIVLARLRMLMEGVQQIGAQQDLSQRVQLSGSDELSHLAEAINQAMDTLEQAEHDRRQAEVQREELWHELNESRRTFIATVSHELRTPLTPIRGYVDMMMQGMVGEINEEQNYFLTMIHQNSLRMEAMVSDLLVIGQLDAGHVQIEQEPLNVEEIVRGVLPMLEQKILQGQLSVSLDLGANLPLIYADQYRVEQILANLLSNAVKYTPSGGKIGVTATPHDNTFMKIAVSDTGIGMSAEEQERLFTPFYRTEGALRSQIQGTGLGLSIVHSLVLLHGGSVEVLSAPGEGSTFQITLPIYCGPPTDETIRIASYTSTAAS